MNSLKDLCGWQCLGSRCYTYHVWSFKRNKEHHNWTRQHMEWLGNLNNFFPPIFISFVKLKKKNIGENRIRIFVVYTFKRVPQFLLFQCMKSPVIKPPPFTSFFGKKRRKKRQAQKNDNETDPFSGFEDLTDDDFFDEVGYGGSN